MGNERGATVVGFGLTEVRFRGVVRKFRRGRLCPSQKSRLCYDVGKVIRSDLTHFGCRPEWYGRKSQNTENPSLGRVLRYVGKPA